MSYEDYLEWADEDVHAEWVHGEAIAHLPPKEWHQNLLTFLAALLRARELRGRGREGADRSLSPATRQS